MKLIYVASPYAGDVERNTEFAKKACRHVMNEGHAFFAPHLLYPAILDEHQPKQRQLGKLTKNCKLSSIHAGFRRCLTCI
ncbi:MAG: hypothetical protein ACFWUM_02070 [Eubacteriales bacterium]